MANKAANKDKKKNTIIVLLSSACILLIALMIFMKFSSKTVTGSSKFLQSVFSLQDKVSTYIGKSTSDTFGVYTAEEITTGKLAKTGEEIKDNDDKSLTPLVDTDKKQEKNDKIAYKINDENLKKILNTSMPTYEGVEFYIQDGTTVKVNLTSKPDWWTEDLDFLLVGKD